MAAIIRFSDGLEATLTDKRGTWECSNLDVKEMLELVTQLLPWDYHPDWIASTAEKVAKEMGAEVIHTDPYVDNRPPGTVY